MVWLTFYAHWVVISVSSRARFQSIRFVCSFRVFIVVVVCALCVFKVVHFDWLKGSLARAEWECRALSSIHNHHQSSYYAEVDNVINLCTFCVFAWYLPLWLRYMAAISLSNYMWMYLSRFEIECKSANVFCLRLIRVYYVSFVSTYSIGKAQQVISITPRMKLFFYLQHAEKFEKSYLCDRTKITDMHIYFRCVIIALKQNT